MAVLDDDDLSETGIAGELFNSCINLFWTVLMQTSPYVSDADTNQLPEDPTVRTLGRDTLRKQRELFEKFYFWGHGFARRPSLDTILELSAPLKWHVISLLGHVGRTIIALDEVDSQSGIGEPDTSYEYRNSRKSSKRRAELESVLSRCTTLLVDNSKLNSPDESLKEYAKDQNGLIEELEIFIQCLVDLTPCLEHPAPDPLIAERSTERPELSNDIRSLAQPWCRRIFDMFPKIDATLAERLGVLNWNRFNSLRTLADNLSLREKPDQADDTHTTPFITEASTSTHHLKSTNASTSVGTDVTAPDLDQEDSKDEHTFDDFGTRPWQETDLETVLTSRIGTSSTFRVPDIPSMDKNGKRTCTVCMHELKQSIQTRTDWKRHVYHDLSPYTCTTISCELSGMETFSSRHEWVEHEFQQHLAERVWLCSTCSARTATKDTFIQHVERNHPEYNWMEEHIAIEAAESVGLRMKLPLTCPLCQINLEPSLAVYAQHVGRHLEQIALVVLQNRSFGSIQEDESEIETDDSGDMENDGSLHLQHVPPSDTKEQENDHRREDERQVQTDVMSGVKAVLDDLLDSYAKSVEQAFAAETEKISEFVPESTKTRTIHRTNAAIMRKFAVLGSRNTQKSSLVIRFVDNVFVESYYPTIQNTFSKGMRLNNQDYIVEIVDTAGQDEYSILNSNHFIGTHGFMIVYSVASRISFEMAQIIREKTLHHLGVDNYPIVLVGTYDLDQIMKREVSREEGMMLARSFDCAWVEANPQDNTKVYRSFELLLLEVERNSVAGRGKDKCSLM